MTKAEEKKLLKSIEKVVEDHSGGLKLTELLAEIMTRERFFKINTETILKVISKSKTLKILEYTWKTCNRQKLFIYTE